MPSLSARYALRAPLSAHSGLRAPFVSTLRALRALACQHVSFSLSGPRPGAQETPLPVAVGSTLVGMIRDNLVDMLSAANRSEAAG
jgi:hypothetical protein